MSSLYSIAEHQHRAAAWAAATAARASKLCRFGVEEGVAVLEASGFNADFDTPDKLPEPERTDNLHSQWRATVIIAAQQRGLTFTHGVAAKLINVYLKVRFVCAGVHGHERVQCLHPPIDRLLLETLAKSNVGGLRKKWAAATNKGWSKFDSSEYEEVVGMIRLVLAGQPTWTIEQHWKGYQ